MADHTIVAVYDTAAHAEAAVSALEAANVPSSAISRHSQSGSMSGGTTTAAPAAGQERGFWSSLFGAEPDSDTSVYDRTMASGGTVVTVKVPDEHHDAVAAILESHNPIDLDERAQSYGLSGASAGGMAGASTLGSTSTLASGTASLATATDGKIQLSEESLQVGKRAVQGGTTRIRRYVVETPVEEQVSLHSERVIIERNPVTDGRPVTGTEFTDKVLEMTETDEQAVVAKTARVVEEVGLRKEGVDRVETVKDTVRREDVRVETIPGESLTTGTTTGTLTPKV